MSEQTAWEQFFDRHAPVYDMNDFTRGTISEVDFLIDEMSLQPGASILDVGCGTGRHSVELAKRGCSVTGIDLSVEMLKGAAEAAARAGVVVDLIQADATRFSLERKYDAAICLCEGAFGLLGRTDDPIEQPLAILYNISNSLKLHGGLVMTVLNGAALFRKHTNSDVEEGRFNPLTIVESSAYPPREGLPAVPVRERAFVATELALMLRLAGMSVKDTWGGTAGNWGRRMLDMDEIEIMVVASKTGEPVSGAR